MEHEIRTLAEGEKISEPGLYNISLDVHHNQPCDGPSVTSGVLRKMELATPADVWAFSKLNPDRWPTKETKALTLGRAMAAYIEGGEDQLEKEYFVLRDDDPMKPTANMIATYTDNKLADDLYRPIPADAPKPPLSSVTRKFKEGTLGAGPEKQACEYWEKANATGKKFVPQKEFDKLEDIRKRVEFWARHDADTRDKLSVNDHTMISDMGSALVQDVGAAAALGGIPEVTMAYQDPMTGIWVLARPDNISFDGTVVDYKKMNTMGSSFTYRLVDQRITDHGYDMQLALGAEAMEMLGIGWPTMAGIVAQWDNKPHHVILREISEEDLRFGQHRNRRALNRFHECLTSGHWPGPGEDVGAYQRPQWQREQLLEEMQIEGTAP